jgi:hypothetical protein
MSPPQKATVLNANANDGHISKRGSSVCIHRVARYLSRSLSDPRQTPSFQASKRAPPEEAESRPLWRQRGRHLRSRERRAGPALRQAGGATPGPTRTGAEERQEAGAPGAAGRSHQKTGAGEPLLCHGAISGGERHAPIWVRIGSRKGMERKGGRRARPSGLPAGGHKELAELFYGLEE